MKQEGRRRTKLGVVVSSKMSNTVVVRVERVLAHPQYGKVIRRSKKYYAHDASNELVAGTKVKIEECRPMSKLKRWKVVDQVSAAAEA